ncbi:MAG TPA: TMEM175 family protein [Acidimicrobiales bacterium]|nr:TMEM175 family protein [Acidimicrobiales bacterium]
MPEDDEGGAASIGLGRMLALSDGVFAIAMTLVAFQIKVPALRPHASLLKALGHEGGSYLSYVLTFSVIGLFWLAHHRIFRNVDQATESLMLLNLLLLMAVAALPLPSSLLGQYGSQRSAVILYAASMVVVGLLLTALTVLAYRRRLLAPTASGHELRLGLWRSGSMVMVFAASIPVAVVAPTVAPFVWIATFPLRFADPRFWRRRRGATDPASGPSGRGPRRR